MRRCPLQHMDIPPTYVACIALACGYTATRITRVLSKWHPHFLPTTGKNPAYDYFPCQHQLYYRGKGKGQIWWVRGSVGTSTSTP